MAILLCTRNGARYLAEQLESIAAQTHHEWVVWASDDGSSDDTLAILRRFAARWAPGRLSIVAGPCAGFAANFLSLTCCASIDADYFAYADQDDIWEPDKLARAVAVLRSVPPALPALYCSRTRSVDVRNLELGLSPPLRRPPGFGNALVQNIVAGNTAVLNREARQLLLEAGDGVDVVSHDWWAYLVVSGCGGLVLHDAYPSLRYRQHAANAVGADTGWAGRLGRLGRLWQGRFRNWNGRNIRALAPLRHRLTASHRRMLDEFSVARSAPLRARLLGVARSGIYRQSPLDDIALILAACFKRL